MPKITYTASEVLETCLDEVSEIIKTNLINSRICNDNSNIDISILRNKKNNIVKFDIVTSVKNK